MKRTRNRVNLSTENLGENERANAVSRNGLAILCSVLVFLSFFGVFPSLVHSQESMPTGQDAAAKWLSANGQKVEKREGVVKSLTIDREIVSIKELRIFSDLTDLAWSHAEGYQDLQNLEQLESLRIHSGVITPENLEKICKIPKLKTLAFESSETLPSLSPLSKCKSLEKLLIKRSPDTDFASLESLASCVNLRELSIGDESYIITSSTDTTKGMLKDSHLKLVGKIESLQRVKISHGQLLTEQGLRELAVLPKLESVEFESANVSGRGFDSFSSEQLKTISIVNCRFSAEGLSAIAQMSQLENLIFFPSNGKKISMPPFQFGKTMKHLELYRFEFKDRELAGLTEISSLQLTECLGLANAGIELQPKLSELAVCDCVLRQSEIAAVAQSPALKRIGIYGTRIRSDWVTPLAEMKSLETVELSGCKFLGDEAIEKFAKTPNLKTLGLANLRRVTDKSLTFLAESPNLEKLGLSDLPKISLTGFQSFPNQHPLKHLTLGSLDSISLAGIESLKRIQGLVELRLSYMKLTDQHIKAIMRLESLEELKFHRSFGPKQHLLYQDLIQTHPNLSKDR